MGVQLHLDYPNMLLDRLACTLRTAIDKLGRIHVRARFYFKLNVRELIIFYLLMRTSLRLQPSPNTFPRQQKGYYLSAKLFSTRYFPLSVSRFYRGENPFTHINHALGLIPAVLWSGHLFPLFLLPPLSFPRFRP